MSYVRQLGNVSVDMDVPVSAPVRQFDQSVQWIQMDLQRLGHLPQGSGSTGADGKFGPRTAEALQTAARQVGWSQPAFAPANAGSLQQGTVHIPTGLIRLLQAAPAPGSASRVAASPSPANTAPPAIVIGPHLDPPPSDREEPADGSWMIWTGVGVGVLALGGVIAWAMRARRAVAANRRRRSRRRISRRR
jgi:hypothetical protein